MTLTKKAKRRNALIDAAERLFWTLVVTTLSAVTTVQVLDLSVKAWQIAVMQAITAAVQLVLQYGRQRLAVLPDPGQGLPGLRKTTS